MKRLITGSKLAPFKALISRGSNSLKDNFRGNLIARLFVPILLVQDSTSVDQTTTGYSSARSIAFILILVIIVGVVIVIRMRNKNKL